MILYAYDSEDRERRVGADVNDTMSLMVGADLLTEAQVRLQYHNGQKQDKERSEIETCCLLLIDKVRDTDKTYI